MSNYSMTSPRTTTQNSMLSPRTESFNQTPKPGYKMVAKTPQISPTKEIKVISRLDQMRSETKEDTGHI